MSINGGPSTLQKVVQEAIDQGRLGTPRFLRCIARAEKPEGLRPTLETMLAMAEGWFGSQPVQRHVLGVHSQNYMAELLKWSDGQGALLAVSSPSSQSLSAVDLVLVGSKGTLYHEG